MKNWSLIRLIVVIIFAVVIISLILLEEYFKADIEVAKAIGHYVNVVTGVGAVLLVIFLGYMMTRQNQTNH